MKDEVPNVSSAFMTFMKEAPAHSGAWAEMVQSMGAANVLDAKSSSLAYLAVLAASGLVSGVPFHVKEAKKAGASRDEIISAILIGLPAVGNRVTQALPAAITAYDE